MIKIAFVKTGGLQAGGTEKFLQTVATNLPKDKFKVDYYYTAPVDFNIMNYIQQYNIHLIEYKAKMITKNHYIKAIDSNFFEVFSNGYDLIFTGRCGYPEEPFSQINNIPIIDSIHYVNGVDNQFNISRVLHISEFSKKMWIRKGGDPSRIVMVSHPIKIPDFKFTDVRKKFNLPNDTFLFGFHQRRDDSIFSDIPLNAYKLIENESNALIICGGSRYYRDQAVKLGLKKVFFIDHTSNSDELYSFLKSLNVYTHGRKDGELNSTALAEALYFSLPIITHPSNRFNGHLEIIDGNGFVANNFQEYAEWMQKLEGDKILLNECFKHSLAVFQKRYEPFPLKQTLQS